MVDAEQLTRYTPNIYKIPYDRSKLYNVLLNEHSTMSINNLTVETLNPNNVVARIYKGNYTSKQKNTLIKMINYDIEKNIKIKKQVTRKGLKINC
jgi:hypothetical protein